MLNQNYPYEGNSIRGLYRTRDISEARCAVRWLELALSTALSFFVPLACLSKSLRCNKGIEVVTRSRLLQEDSQTQGKPLLGISPRRLRKASGGRRSLVCTNTSDAALTDPEHLRGVRASGGNTTCGARVLWDVERPLVLCLVLLYHGVLHFYRSTVVPESNHFRSTPPENCLALSSGQAAL